LSADFKKILIVLPAFNEATAIRKVILAIRKTGFQNISVINDGSSDNTAEVAKKAGAIVVTHSINRGAGAASQTGLVYARQAGFSYAVLMDSDGQHLPEDIYKLLEKMQQTNADIVVGNRFADNENTVPKRRVFYNQIANIFTNFFCKKNYPDTQSGFRLLNRKAMKKIQLYNRGFGFCSEMLIQAERLDLQIEFTPIQVLYTNYSMSKGQGLMEGYRTAKSILWSFIFK